MRKLFASHRNMSHQKLGSYVFSDESDTAVGRGNHYSAWMKTEWLRNIIAVNNL